MLTLRLPFPPASLSGHNTGHFRVKAPIVAELRKMAAEAARSVPFEVAPDGDIQIGIFFYPPNKRGDRVNFAIRMKPLLDGIADGLGVNDNRFLPSYYFADPGKPGHVIVEVFGIPLRASAMNLAVAA